MTNEPATKTDIRGFVGRNVSRLLEIRGWPQDDLARRAQVAGLAKWDQTVVSRIASGQRTLSLEDAVVLSAVFSVPLVELLHGEGQVLLAGAPVPAAQLRDVVSTGRVADAHRGDSLLDTLTTGTDDSSLLAARIASELGVTARQVERAAWALWSLRVDDELERRMAESTKAFTGTDPRDARFAGTISGITVDARRRRAWQGHHVPTMADELRDEFEMYSHQGRKR
jgi:transcriptional regulator with XRE-family HTH domain